MPRRAALLLLPLALALFAPTTETGAQEKPKLDVEKIFKFGDTNKDSKLSRAEFDKLMQNNAKLKGNSQAIDYLFDLLDANKDNALTLEEFRKITTLEAKKDKQDKPAVPDKDIPATAEGIAFFEKHIRPVLISKCIECHSSEAKKRKGGLALDTRASTRAGGDSGPALVPGKPEKSLLIQALSHKGDIKMPPKEMLSADTIADFTKWVKMGAPDPRADNKPAKYDIDIEKGRQFWSFQRPKSSAQPLVKNTAWPRNDIDRHLLATLEAKNMKPVGDADRRTLLRRVYFDLIGLPPTPEVVEAFANDQSPTSFEIIVDKLLASERFGERWGRHWLDVARYAETSGRQVNINYPHAWRYRDYVIAAFNADKPYDRFVTEQLAGDLLPYADEKQHAEQLIATGFLAIGPKPHNERNPTQFAYDLADEQIDATTQAFLGLTVACARCHDHKFDPVPQKDYYALAGIFRSTETRYGTPRLVQNAHPTELITLAADSGQPAGVEKATATKLESLKKQVAEFDKEIADIRKEGKLFTTQQGVIAQIRRSLTQAQLDRYHDDGTPKLLAMGVRDRASARDSAVLQRGEIDKPGDTVSRGFVQVVSNEFAPPKITSGSGRRELAQWMTKDNPLTSRVMVNRVWLHLFGRGLVSSVDNFGTTGHAPSHPELLDNLALAFEKDWSVKKLIRRIVLTRTYQLASTHDDANYEIDPDNALIWRMSKRRLEAETLRDSMLAAAGVLDLTPPKGSAIATVGDGLSQAFLRAGPLDARSLHRAVYLPVIRDHQLDSMSLFDFADSTVVTGERATTTVPAQSLYLMNNPTVVRIAEEVATKVLKTDGDDQARLKAAYLRCLSRPPSERELKTATDFLARYTKILATDGVPASRQKSAAWSAFCQALFASAEFQYRN